MYFNNLYYKYTNNNIICFVILSIRIILVSSKNNKPHTPVFIITDHNISRDQFNCDYANPLHEVTPDTFKSILQKYSVNHNVLFFIEPYLSVEDVSKTFANGTTPFVYLRSRMKNKLLQYLPTVRFPYRTIREMFPFKTGSVFYLTNHLMLPKLEIDKLKYSYIIFNDGPRNHSIGNEKRSNGFGKHDEIMKLIVQNVTSKEMSTVAIYTGMRSDYSIPELRATKRTGLDVMTTASGSFMLACNRAFSKLEHSLDADDVPPSLDDEHWSEKLLQVRVQWIDKYFQLGFEFTPRHWFLRNITIDVDGEKFTMNTNGISAPINRSYACGLPWLIVGHNMLNHIKLNKFQMQPHPLRLNRQSKPQRFSESEICTSWFTGPILCVLFVVSILLLVLFLGIIMVLDIRAVDRFEDPQGAYFVNKVD